MWYADETGVYFHTGAMKPVYSQLKNNPKIEACFYHPDEKGGVMMRVAGKVEFLDDVDLRRKLIEERQFLKAWGFTPENADLAIFRIAKEKPSSGQWKPTLIPRNLSTLDKAGNVKASKT